MIVMNPMNSDEPGELRDPQRRMYDDEGVNFSCVQDRGCMYVQRGDESTDEILYL